MTPVNGIALAIPDELVELIATRAAELLEERHRAPAPDLLTVDETANLLRGKRQRVYDLLSQGRLPHLKDGSRVLVHSSDLLGYLEGSV
jgi:excisionase family DNA binding protein